MAKPYGLYAPAALLALLGAPHAYADWKFTPSVDLRETYTDNVALESEAKARGRFVTEVAPGFSLRNEGPRIKFNADYRYHYYAFDDDGVEGVRHSQSQLRADVRAKLVEDLLFLDADASYGQQAVSAFGPQVNYNGYASANRSNVKSYRVSPYLRQRYGSFASAELRYTHDNVDTGIADLGETTRDNLRLNIASGAAFRTVGWGINASRERLDDTSLAPTSDVAHISGNLSYRLTGALSLTASTGYDEYDYQSIEGPNKGSSWSVGVDWAPTKRTSLVANAGRRYYGDSYFLRAMHRSRHSVWSINYSDAVTTTRAQYLLPATIDTASMLDRLFTADIADPDLRRLAVEAYMRSTGLPAALAENINYFSNRYMLQKQLQASVAYSTAKTTTIFSVFDTRSESLSSTTTDSPLTGVGSSSLNTDTRQRGGSVLWNWRINKRSGMNVSYTSARAESTILAALRSDNRAFRIAATRQFQKNLRGALELRRVSGITVDRVGRYRENAITASLSLLF